jgi:endonuclease YncB( thermonuclease family)
MPAILPPAIICDAPRAIDGDTLACANLARHVRLAGIDAPELPGHCRRGRVCTPGDPFAARAALAALLATGPVQIFATGTDRYGRMLARVTAGRVDTSCRLLATRIAVARYGWINCA